MDFGHFGLKQGFCILVLNWMTCFQKLSLFFINNLFTKLIMFMATVSGHNQCNKFFFRLINRVGKITDFGYSINRVRVWEAGCTPPPWDINTKTRISQIVIEFYVLTSNPKMNPSCRTHNQIYGQKKAIDQHLGKEHGCSTDKNQSNLFTLNICMLIRLKYVLVLLYGLKFLNILV